MAGYGDAAVSVPLAEALAVAEMLVRRLAPWTTRAEIAGSIRRRAAVVRDIEIVAVPARAITIFDDRPMLDELREVARIWGRTPKAGDRYIQVEDVLGSDLTLDLFLVHEPAEWGPIYAIRTGPAAFSQMLVSKIKGRLWHCHDGWVADELGARVPCPEESDFFAAARVAWAPPDLRR